MKKHVENLKDWVFAPFGRAWLFALVFSAFSLSVIADLASTYHLLSQENWNLEIEQNVFSRFIFAKFGFSGGALLILIGELLLIFFVVLPLFWRRTKPGARMFARQISIVCLLGLALYFSLIALENLGLVSREPFSWPSLLASFNSITDTVALFARGGFFIANILTVYLLATPIKPPFHQ